MPSFKYENRATPVGNGLVPEGMIALQVMDSQHTCDKISGNGNEYINLQLEMVGKYNDLTKSWERTGGGKLFDKLMFTEKAVARVDNFLSSAGKAPALGEEINLEAAYTIGWIVYAVVYHDADPKKKDTKYPIDAVVASYIKAESEFHPLSKPVVAPTMQQDPEPVAPTVQLDPGSCPF